MSIWYINYHTAEGGVVFRGTLEQAIVAAEEDASCTGKDITIHAASGNPVLCREWNKTRPTGTEEDIITFRGVKGYYGPWHDAEDSEDWGTVEQIEALLSQAGSEGEPEDGWEEARPDDLW